MLICEILLRNQHLLKHRNEISKLFKIIKEYYYPEKVLLVKRNYINSSFSFFRKISETELEKEIEYQNRSELFRKYNEFIVIKKELLYWFDDYDTEIEYEDKVISFRIFGEITDEEILQIVYSKISLFNAYYCPLYEVISEFIEKHNEIIVKFSENFVFIEPYEDEACSSFASVPFYLPFLVLKKEEVTK